MIKNKKESMLKKICFAVFIVYVLFLAKIILFKYTGILDLAGKIAGGDLDGFRSLNLIPFQSIRDFGKLMMNQGFSRGFINLAGNLLVFAPVGYFLPLLSGRCRKLLPTFFCGLVLSVIFEFCQYFLYLGSADIDDVILNGAGVILGFFCFRWLQRWTRENAGRQYGITLLLAAVGFAAALTVAVNYFGLMFGLGNHEKRPQTYDESFLEELDNVQIETNAQQEFDILGDIVTLDGEVLTVNQVVELDENAALSSNDNRNLKTICLLPSTQYSRLDIYDIKGERTETRPASREDLQEGQRIDMEGYVDGDRYVATRIVINNYLFET